MWRTSSSGKPACRRGAEGERPPRPHWRSYTDGPLPFPIEAPAIRSLPSSWFPRIECNRCGKTRWLNEAYVPEAQRRMLLRDLLTPCMRHEGYGGRAARAELLSSSEGVRSRPVRRIVLRGWLKRGLVRLGVVL
jgi:hypothetical protein